MNILPSVLLSLFALFCTIVAVQVFYYLFFFRRLAAYKPSQKAETQEYPVSIIICARDEAHNLAKNLPGILVQGYRTSHEIIVVNDNSKDESKYLLDEFKKSFKNLIPVQLSQEAKLIPGKKFPLSMGIKTARYEIVLLTDADCMPASEFWLQKMQDAYQPGIDIVLGYGAYHKMPGILNKLIRFETFHSALQYFSFALAGLPYMGVGRNLSYKKALFFNNKGFSSINQIPGGDDDLFINMVANKKNTAIVIDPETYTLSSPKKTWKEWWRQKNRHYSAARYYKPKHKFLLGLYSLTHAMLYPLLIVALFYNWWIALSVYGVRLLLQSFIWYKSMKKLQEVDLWPMFLLFDIWMFVYYFLFVPALWKKPKQHWN
ncbi:Glycosyltransferase, catalytic subunit of cellulose synthase and poly-beta-1,6-N-acetylglucosamine synthase [Filimonas lacunae]|uniref:Glycosyltransferase, catalytic subunit of cellulose synthase and poly-beta-1,6-N-acetylglucosamine synthase n=1 Tax=Filimonas lacunae TaxID=477680 RepID=A0A173M9T2_9BACT|nr:glycosyltransferase [Filimonas lacunae]BAV04303.1 N-acetylglucosaminyltransferase [Filimonas lacunae]SIT30964.1 Glycosyltransferase, catalytic subunit of cellulose synthase and poly-beta-1,6-N-acetylglucosamine synthase [Filimonas lacunae]